MAITSRRRVQRIKDMLMRIATDRELDEPRGFLNKRPSRSNDERSFLALPPEIRNRICHCIAQDAHATAATFETAISASHANVYGVRDAAGKTMRPGILGTCRQMFLEFHSIFYSPVYIKLKLWHPSTGFEYVRDSATLDASVNEKHYFMRESEPMDERSVEERKVSWATMLASTCGVREMCSSNGEILFTAVRVIFLKRPWLFATRIQEKWSVEHTCRPQGTSSRAVPQAERCGMCLVSMGPEKAALDPWPV